jgi:hypothetical protein
MGSVVPFQRRIEEPFPLLWPKETYEAVVHGLYRNQPEKRAPQAGYNYAIKADLAGTPCAVIVQPHENVLYRGGTKTQKNEAFERWYARYYSAFTYLSREGFTGTLVGKMGQRGGVEVFCCYYIVKGSEIILDSGRIEMYAKTRQKLFDDSFFAMEVIKQAVVYIDKEKGDIQAQDVFDVPGLNAPFIGLPITTIEVRETDGIVTDMPPRLHSTDVHMRYMAFSFTKRR